MKKSILFLILFLFSGCSIHDAYNISAAAMSNNPSIALKSLAKSKAINYTLNPKKLSNDLKFLSSLLENIDLIWGKNNRKIPKQKEYVKYMQNYKSRASIDFDNGIVTVETIDEKDAMNSLKNAIVTTLLLPEDPRAFDLFGSGEIKLGKTPYLYKEIKDDQNKFIRYEWRANRFADLLIKTKIKNKTIKNKNKPIKVTYVDIQMVKDHTSVRVDKFKPIVKQFAKKYNISENLVYAIIKTESNFNQFAISNAGAIGLMQVVPTSAGKDAYVYSKGKNWTPSNSYLFDAQNNVELGTAYLKLLNSKYLFGINNEVSKEYCVISAYNTGSGNVLKTFSKKKNRAISSINEKTPAQVYKTLRNSLPYEETKNYLKKVINYKKDFINL